MYIFCFFKNILKNFKRVISDRWVNKGSSISWFFSKLLLLRFKIIALKWGNLCILKLMTCKLFCKSNILFERFKLSFFNFVNDSKAVAMCVVFSMCVPIWLLLKFKSSSSKLLKWLIPNDIYSVNDTKIPRLLLDRFRLNIRRFFLLSFRISLIITVFFNIRAISLSEKFNSKEEIYLK